VAVSLKKHGAGRGAAISFLLSTPQTGVDSILVTYGMLGPVFAVFRPLAAFLTGVLGGGLTDLISRENDPDGAGAAPCRDACCAHAERRGWLLRAARHGFVVLPRDIAKAMLLGLLAAGVIAAMVPDDFFAGALGTGVGAMLLMMVLGIPVYVCATASVPIAATLVLDKGVSPGVALVFLLTGPATNAAAFMTIWKSVGRNAAAVYLATVAVSALACGIILDYLFNVAGIRGLQAPHHMLPGWVGSVCAVVLLGILGFALVKPRSSRGVPPEEDEPDAQKPSHPGCRA
jgi:uncharacterized membrane protein YraQ (UPF0718 family)